MEDAMLRFCIVIAGAALIMMGSAAAQSAGNAVPGKPISLLQILLHPAKAKPNLKPHTKFAHNHTIKSTKRFASRKTHRAAQNEAPASSPAPTAADAAPATMWPAADTNSFVPDSSAPAAAAPVAPTAATPAAAAPVAATAAAPDAQSPSAQSSLSEMVVDGRTVQFASPNEVNAIDLAADEPHEIAPAQGRRAEVAEPTASFVAVAQQDDSDKSRDAWYEELLATLGGALAAGTVAWLLIGSAPPRKDGRDRILTYEIERMTR
jgi:hypothetical protein